MCITGVSIFWFSSKYLLQIVTWSTSRPITFDPHQFLFEVKDQVTYLLKNYFWSTLKLFENSLLVQSEIWRWTKSGFLKIHDHVIDERFAYMFYTTVFIANWSKPVESHQHLLVVIKVLLSSVSENKSEITLDNLIHNLCWII